MLDFQCINLLGECLGAIQKFDNGLELFPQTECFLLAKQGLLVDYLGKVVQLPVVLVRVYSGAFVLLPLTPLIKDLLCNVVVLIRA